MEIYFQKLKKKFPEILRDFSQITFVEGASTKQDIKGIKNLKPISGFDFNPYEN